MHTPAASVVLLFFLRLKSFHGCFCDGCKLPSDGAKGCCFAFSNLCRRRGAPLLLFGNEHVPNRCETCGPNLVLFNQRLQGSSNRLQQCSGASHRRFGFSLCENVLLNRGFNGPHLNRFRDFFEHGFADVLHGRLFLRYNRRLRDRLANRSNRFRHGDRLAHGASGLCLSSQRTSAGHRCTHVAQAKTWFFLHLLTHQSTKWATGGSAQCIGSCPECGRVHGTSTEGSRRLPGDGLHPLLTLFGSGVG